MTTDAPSPVKRWYDDACATAHALELLGERWSLLIVRELLFGPRRFSELRAGLPTISANVLAQRLEGLEATGVAARRVLPPPASAQVYELTPWGYEAEPIIQAVSRWAVRSPHHDPTQPLSAAAIMSSFRTMISPDRAADLKASLGFRIGRDGFVARIADGELAVTREDPDTADATFAAQPETLAALVYTDLTLKQAEASGALTLTGDRKLAQRFTTLFVLPPKAGS